VILFKVHHSIAFKMMIVFKVPPIWGDRPNRAATRQSLPTLASHHP